MTSTSHRRTRRNRPVSPDASHPSARGKLLIALANPAPAASRRPVNRHAPTLSAATPVGAVTSTRFSESAMKRLSGPRLARPGHAGQKQVAPPCASARNRLPSSIGASILARSSADHRLGLAGGRTVSLCLAYGHRGSYVVTAFVLCPLPPWQSSHNGGSSRRTSRFATCPSCHAAAPAGRKPALSNGHGL